ncbi:hypothetical protein ACFQZZ_33270 [Nocardia sp. GCM10030253]|uniref:hypothetical protein n=1 Tax=Nocardia sp. GCM10030253 TaxID=3273404 RepID=UPI00363B6C61
MFRSKKTPAAAHPPSGDIQALADELSNARGRLELLGGDAADVLAEVPSEAELAEKRGLAEWRRAQLREAERAALAAQLAADAKIREADAKIREADIRDVVGARMALADQRRADSPASTIAELRRYGKGYRYGCAAIIAIGMIWSAVNVQKNMAPGGVSDPMFWVSFLVEGMISGLLVIIAVGTAKHREAAGVEPAPAVQAAEVGLFLLTLGLNTYPYLSATYWYQATLHGIAPVLIGGSLWVLHYLGRDNIRSREIVARRITDDLTAQLPDLHALHTQQPSAAHTAATPSTTTAGTQQHQDVAARTTDPIAEFEAEFDPAPEPALTTVSEPAPHFDPEESAAPHRTSPEVDSTALVDASAGSGAGSADVDTIEAGPAPHQPTLESAGPTAEPADEAPEPARTGTSTAPTSADAPAPTVSAGEVREEVRATRAPRTRTAHPSRTSGAGSAAPTSAGARAQSALALATVESAGESADGSAGSAPEVRGVLTALAHEVRDRGVGRRLDLDTVVRVLEMAAVAASTNAIHSATGVHRTTVDKIRATSEVARAEAIAGGAGGRVIELRKPDRT